MVAVHRQDEWKEVWAWQRMPGCWNRSHQASSFSKSFWLYRPGVSACSSKRWELLRRHEPSIHGNTISSVKHHWVIRNQRPASPESREDYYRTAYEQSLEVPSHGSPVRPHIIHLLNDEGEMTPVNLPLLCLPWAQHPPSRRLVSLSSTESSCLFPAGWKCLNGMLWSSEDQCFQISFLFPKRPLGMPVSIGVTSLSHEQTIRDVKEERVKRCREE